jgi:hypothetical protein
MKAMMMMETQTESLGTPQATLTHEFKVIILEYVTRVNSRYRANEFTSSQLAKNILTVTGIEKTRFAVVHRIVREILRSWEEQGLCAHISRTKYSRCRKTKDTYRFRNQGLREIKKQAIEETIRAIGKSEPTTTPIMRTRDHILRDRLEELLDSVRRTPQQVENKET